MGAEAVPLHARQFQRHATRFEARVEPHPDHVEQLRMSYPDGLAGLAVIDVSEGGLGLQIGFFLPRNLRLTLHVTGVQGAGGAAREVAIRAVVRRCVMVDHKPTYQIGLQFLDRGGEAEQALIQAATQAMETEPEPVLAGGARVS